MKNESYCFDPEDYGYEPLSKFPELEGIFGSRTFIKVVEIDKQNIVPTYWYSSCRKIDSFSDERWSFNSSAYQQGTRNSSGHQCYLGAISTSEFADSLLCHLLGTTKNSGVEQYGRLRLSRNINSERLEHGQR